MRASVSRRISFGRGAAGDQGMKAADRAAGDGDEREGKNISGEHRAGAVDEAGQRRHVQHGPQRDDSQCQQSNGSQLHERAQVVAGRQQQPDRQRRRCESVDDDQDRQCGTGEREPLRHRRSLRNPLPAPDCQHHQNEAEGRSFQHFAGPQSSQIHSHQKRDGNGHRNGERAPGTSLERIHDHQGAHSEQDHDDADHGNVSHQAAQAANFFPRHFGERLAVAPNREQQNHEVLHAASEDRAGQYPKGPGEIAKLRGQHRTDQRAWAGDGGEVVPEDHPFVGGDKIAAIFQTLGGRGALRIQDQNFRRNELAVETVSDGVGTNRRDHQPHCIDLLASMKCDRGQGQRSQNCDREPNQYTY